MKKSSKKSPFKKKLQAAFWMIFITGCLWVAFAPHHRVPPSNTVIVKVVHPEEKPIPPPPLEVPLEMPSQLSSQLPLHSGGGEEPTSPLPPADVNIPLPTPMQKEETLVPGHKPKIAIVIDDVGVDLKGSERAIQLPPFITLSFLPYAVRLREQAKQARDSGHELLLHMPMEPIGHEDPGPGALIVDLPMRDLQQRFETALASFTGFDGVNNHMGSKFTTYTDGMNMVIDELQQRHLFYFDSRTSAQSVGKKIALEKGLPTIGRDVFLDDDQSPAAIRKQLEETERIAQRRGYAVAIGHPHAATMDVLAQWIPEAERRGFELTSIRSLVGK
jgi:polysaccharide deacetylase 2 family uncharacterized protein YibQ